MDSADRRVVRRPGVVARKVAGEVLLIPLGVATLSEERRSAELFVLNETGQFLWEQLATPASPSDLARKLIKEFDVSLDAATADAVAFVASLRGLGMLSEIETEIDGNR